MANGDQPVFTAGVSCPLPHKWIVGAFVLGLALGWALYSRK